MSLKDKLDEVLNSYEPQPISNLQKAIFGPSWQKLKVGEEFLEAVRSKKEFQEFDEHLQMLGNSSTSTRIINFADWIIERAIRVGSNQALNEVDTYLNSDQVEVFQLMLLAFVHIDDEYEFCNGVKLIKPQSIPNQYVATRIIQDSFLPLPTVESVLIIPYKQKRFHVKNTEANIKFPKPEIPYQALEDVVHCLTLSRFGNLWGVQTIGHGTIAPENLPFIQQLSGWAVPSFKHPTPSPIVLEIEMKKADTLLNEYKQLPKALREKLKVSINKFNGYCSHEPLVEKAINLRTCLESIFLTNDIKYKISKKLSKRAALFLGTNPNEIKEIRELIEKVYDVTSTAVHRGKLPKENVDLLPEAATLAKKAIIKLIKEGEVDWQKIELIEL